MWTNTQTHTCEHTPPVMGWNSEEGKEADEHRQASQTCDSTVEATWGKDLGVLWQQSGKVQGFACLFVGGGVILGLFMPPPPRYQLLTLARRQGVCNMAQAWLYPRHGNPYGLQRRPGAHVGSVCWLGDKFLLVRREEAASITLFSFAACAAEGRVWWGHAAPRPC